MAKTGKSLHQVVGSWLAPTAAEKLCVTRLKSRNSLRERYVFVEAYKDTGPVGLYFFTTRMAGGAYSRQRWNDRRCAASTYQGILSCLAKRRHRPS